MKLLFDQNLSHKLLGLLCDLFPDSEHVGQIGLRNASDDDVWKYAATHGYVIVTKG